MISFKEYIRADKSKFSFFYSKKELFRVWILCEHEYIIWRYQVLLRKEEYYRYINRNILLAQYYRYRKNKLGERLGFTIGRGSFGPGLRIWHYGNIVVNGGSKIGKNCVLHGDNCIGNNGFININPVIGDNVDIGVGAKIIGNVTIGNNVKIGAGAVVNKSILEDNVVIAGVPARIVKRLPLNK